MKDGCTPPENKITESSDTKKLVKWSFWGVILGTACCWLPLVLIMLGVINISTALTIGYQSTYFFAAGFTLVIIALTFYWKRRWKNVCTTKENIKKDILITVIVLAAVIGVSFLIKHYLLPIIASWVYSLSFN